MKLLGFRIHWLLYVGGFFLAVFFGYLALVAKNSDAINVTADLGGCAVNGGTVESIVTDTDGSKYLGGAFTSIACTNGTFNVTSLAHINADDTFDQGFNYNPDDSGSFGTGVGSHVYALYLGKNDRLYVGGAFTTYEYSAGINTVANMVVIDKVNGGPNYFDPDFAQANGAVRAFAPFNGYLYLGGDFSQITDTVGAHTVWGVAPIGLSTNPGVFDTTWTSVGFKITNAAPQIQTLLVNGNFLYVGGNFNKVVFDGGTQNSVQSNLAKINIFLGPNNNSFVEPFLPNPDNTVYALEKSANSVYVGGAFTNISGSPQNGFAAYSLTTDLTDGTITAFPDNTVRAIKVIDDDLIIAGAFTTVGGSARNNAALYSINTGSLQGWAPGFNNTVRAISTLTGSEITFVGAFTSIGPDSHKRIADFSASSQTVSGTIFEDMNYGGGAGRNLTASTGGVRFAGAIVELYDDNGIYLTQTTTGLGGIYSFTVPEGHSYSVRVVNNSLISPRNVVMSGTAFPVQTYIAENQGTLTEFTNKVGGEDPSKVDAAENIEHNLLATLQSGITTTVQSLAEVTVTTIPITDIDVGFNFDTIVNINDAGQGSLRQFIVNANIFSNSGLAQVGQTASLETSIFMIPASEALTLSGINYFSIAPVTEYPTITDPIALDGRTSSLYSTTPIIELDGSGLASGATFFDFDLSTIIAGDTGIFQGFVFNNLLNGIGVVIDSDDTSVKGNFFGTDVTGNDIVTNQMQTGVVVGTLGAYTGITIGGALLDKNIFADMTYGVLDQMGSSGLDVNSNHFGLGNDGTTGLGIDTGLYSIGSSNLQIIDNFFAYALTAGIALGGSGTTTGTTIVGNYIGVDTTGATAVGNAVGIFVMDGVTNLQIGAAGTPNVISGNTNAGIALGGAITTVRIENNFIGTNSTGTTAIANDTGIAVYHGTSGGVAGLMIGGITANKANIISGNNFGVAFAGDITGSRISHNTIGLGSNGAVIPNANGVVLLSSAYPITATSIDNNTISGNGFTGIFLYGNQVTTTTISDNVIGDLASAPSSSLGNGSTSGGYGILIDGSSSNAIINNTIVNTVGGDPNTGAGVMIATSFGSTTGNTITGGSFYNNASLPIDLANSVLASGVTPNDGIGSGSFGNIAIDYPVITSAVVSNGNLTVSGYIGSNPSGSLTFAGSTVVIYKATNDGNQSGEVILGDATSVPHGEGSTYLSQLISDGSGLFTGTFGVSLSAGEYVSAITTSSGNGSSEFGPNKIVTAAVVVIPPDGGGGGGVVLIEACRDGADNELDGLVDMADPGCSNPTDNDEFNTPVIPNIPDDTTDDVVGGVCQPLITGELKLGAVNNTSEVEKLQNFLKTNQHFEDLEVTGEFDLQTYYAVKVFQEKYFDAILAPWGFPEGTGWVSRTTRQAINDLNCKEKLTFTCPKFTGYVGYGDKRGQVSLVQKFLAAFKFYDGKITNVFDFKTKEGIKLFQERYSEEILDPWGFDSGTGLWYKTTRKKANSLLGCQEGAVMLENGTTVN